VKVSGCRGRDAADQCDVKSIRTLKEPTYIAFKKLSPESQGMHRYVSKSKFGPRGSMRASLIWVPHLMHGISMLV